MEFPAGSAVCFPVSASCLAHIRCIRNTYDTHLFFPGKLVGKNFPACGEWDAAFTVHRGAVGTLGSRISCPVESQPPPHLASKTREAWVKGSPQHSCDLGCRVRSSGWMEGRWEEFPHLGILTRRVSAEVLRLDCAWKEGRLLGCGERLALLWGLGTKGTGMNKVHCLHLPLGGGSDTVLPWGFACAGGRDG